MPTIDTLVQEALIDLATGDPQITTTQLTNWWNRRQTTLASQAKWWFMRGNQNVSVTAAGGTGPYSFTGSPQNIEEVLYSGTALDSIPISQGAVFFPGTGSPKAYGLAPVSGGQVPPQLYVFPAPDQTYTLNVYTFARLADMTYGSGQTNVFTDMFPELVKAAMCWAAAVRMDEDAKIKMFKERYEEELLPLLEQQSQFDQKGIYSEPHPSFAASASLLGAQRPGGR